MKPIFVLLTQRPLTSSLLYHQSTSPKGTFHLGTTGEFGYIDTYTDCMLLGVL